MKSQASCSVAYRYFTGLGTPYDPEHELVWNIEDELNLIRTHRLYVHSNEWESEWHVVSAHTPDADATACTAFPLAQVEDALISARSIDPLTASIMAADFRSRAQSLDSLVFRFFAYWGHAEPSPDDRAGLEMMIGCCG